MAVGFYHGLNPAIGWPIAVANGLTERCAGAVLTTLLPLDGGHFAAMAIVLTPFAGLSLYVQWSREIRMGAGAFVLLFGLLSWSANDTRRPWFGFGRRNLPVGHF